MEADGRHEYAERAAWYGEQKALDQQQACESAASRAECLTDREFALAGPASHEQKAGNVCTGDKQQSARCREEHFDAAALLRLDTVLCSTRFGALPF